MIHFFLFGVYFNILDPHSFFALGSEYAFILTSEADPELKNIIESNFQIFKNVMKKK